MTTTVLVSLAVVAVFAAGLYYTHINRVIRAILQETSQGIAAITDKELTDDEKEIIVRRTGLSVFVSGWSIFWRISAT